MNRSRLIVAGLCAVLFSLPAVSQGQTKIRMQSAFPPKGVFADNLAFFAERVKAMSGGRVEIVLLARAPWCRPSTCSTPRTRRSWTARSASAYWVGKDRAAALFGAGARRSVRDGYASTTWAGCTTAAGWSCTASSIAGPPEENVVPLPMTSVGPAAARLVQAAGDGLGQTSRDASAARPASRPRSSASRA